MKRILRLFQAIGWLWPVARAAGIIGYLILCVWFFWTFFGPRGWAP